MSEVEGDSPVKPGTLYLVATPIGNLRDITLRAIDVLKAVDVVACEDTRHSSRLFQRLEISTSKISLHQHNEAARSDEIVARLAKSEAVAVISDAGMPLVSDPGHRLLRRCLEAGHAVEVVPGPSAVMTAVAGSGLPAERFYFGGFLPVKKGQREKALRGALEREVTSVFFESPHRLDGTLEMLAGIESDRLVCVARELTKIHETFHRGKVEEVAAHFAARPPKGEITLVIAGTELPKYVHRNDSA
ncbi:MAG: 16S rRNA (cytidine(1402)-2'-O)-methyltransferase [Verrucomicrobiota bacterium]